MRFRAHRGGLAEALQTQRVVHTWADLLEAVRDELRGWHNYDDTAVTIEPYGGDDDRIGWKAVHIVLVAGWGPAGFVEWGEAFRDKASGAKYSRFYDHTHEPPPGTTFTAAQARELAAQIEGDERQQTAGDGRDIVYIGSGDTGVLIATLRKYAEYEE